MEGPVLCKCDVPASHAVCKKDGAHKGQFFYGCGHFGTERKTCRFFQWDIRYDLPRPNLRPPKRPRSPSLSPPLSQAKEEEIPVSPETRAFVRLALQDYHRSVLQARLEDAKDVVADLKRQLIALEDLINSE